MSAIANHQATINYDIVDWLPDGDTIHTKKGKKLRLLHINTPEINAKSNQSAEPLAKAAKVYLKQLIGQSGQIAWVNDKKRRDKFGRELALVFNEKGVFINARLTEKGLAHVLVIPPNEKYVTCIKATESIAKKDRLGIWSLPQHSLLSVQQIKANNGFQLVRGKITQLKQSNKNLWLILDDYLWVGVPKKYFKYFKKSQLNFQLNDVISLRGYAYQSYGQLRMKLNHPAMIINY